MLRYCCCTTWILTSLGLPVAVRADDFCVKRLDLEPGDPANLLVAHAEHLRFGVVHRDDQFSLRVAGPAAARVLLEEFALTLTKVG